MANRWLVTRRHPVRRLNGELDRVFNDFLFGGFRSLPDLRSGDWVPRLDVEESEEAITVMAEIPGVEPENVEVSVVDDVLTVSGEKKSETEERREGVYHSERRFGSFRRSVALPATVDREKISAEYDKGVLTIRLEKAEEASPKRIPVVASKN